MDYKDLRTKYPIFIYDKFTSHIEDAKLICQFNFSLPPDHIFTHKVVFENLDLTNWTSGQLDNYIFHIGLSEMFSYWKLACSPLIEIQAGNLGGNQIKFWHKLFMHGMGQYFYENQIDFTPHDFVKIRVEESKSRRVEEKNLNSPALPLSRSVLVPIGGGKDSIVTAELLKPHFPIQPVIVYPTTISSLDISHILTPTPPILIHRQLDPNMLSLTHSGYLTGHIPYSAVLAFLFLFVSAHQHIPFIALSNERSSDEGNVKYLGWTINHQYSKSQVFESDFQKYSSGLTLKQVHFFSFLRPLYELQITKLFANFPKYFPIFKSCNRNQKLGTWCGRCPKCISIALTMIPWIGQESVTKIIGINPLIDPANQLLLSQMSDPSQVKPFECIVGTHEAQICLEFISQGQTPRVQKFLSQWGPSIMPKQFENILKQAFID